MCLESPLQILKPLSQDQKDQLFTPSFNDFLTYLHNSFNSRRLGLLGLRKRKQDTFNSGEKPKSSQETSFLRGGKWYAPNPPLDLMDRRVEITGPTDRKMMINALNSGAKVFMADLEDSLTPSWENILDGHLNLQRAI